ncbi:serine hydrolase domain-containing protein [Sphingomonas bacterium]|uniref:serine hydrolase domain-containing protein n=1 Tax=Sphingomonas bacterium TaxID=1895847 RepID=UPI001576ADC2|nr:serine hydrolase domain-containing protein [Sphingomonas bacterium]
MSSGIVVEGSCEPGFEAVAEEFRRNFTERGELGASVAITIEGRPVVDLWAGVADREAGAPWKQDTMAVVYSATKGLAATCLHMLADRSKLDLNAPVADYWPEFAANGKEGITVAMVMSHQAGLPVWQEQLPNGALLDWDLAVGRLAAERPIWEPGTAQGYHAQTLGFLEGEIVRRVDGRTIGAFLREEVAGPLGADAWIGLPEAEHGRVASLVMGDPDPKSAFVRKLSTEPDWYGLKLITNGGGVITDQAALYAAELPAHGGIANARALARVYAPLSLDGSVDGVRLVGEERLAGMRVTRSASDCDLMLRLPTTFTLGYSKSWGARSLGPGSHVIIGEQAFGTPGMGGSIGFADGSAQMSFGYVMNRHGGGVGLNDRGQSLVDAAYQSLGFRSSEPGFWVR